MRPRQYHNYKLDMCRRKAFLRILVDFENKESEKNSWICKSKTFLFHIFDSTSLVSENVVREPRRV